MSPDDFKVGEFVVCINNECVESELDLGRVYTIRHLYVAPNSVLVGTKLLSNVLVLCLEEVRRNLQEQAHDGFAYLRFKPLKKKSIEVFNKLLTSVPTDDRVYND